MTTLFEDRERAAEWAFAHWGEVRFRARCNALRSVAGYAAARLNLAPAATQAYADDLVVALVEGARDEALVERIRADLEARGVIESAETLRQRLILETAASMEPPALDA